ncbi:MAG TPA: ABC transporter ATP-binding protein [bacterium]|nr:ABC transporter ATP-binding protein [bacterium]HQN74238.1 ABC transporter ATP-binding protein [bacterium]HQO91708.1 ABC transporter ATP-binding protein [bacterium]
MTLIIKSLNVQIDGFKIIKNISFSASLGENISIIGPNGAGKTTLLRAVAGLVDFKGTVFINGNDTGKIDILKRAALVSYVAQLSDITGDITVRHFLELSRFHSLKPWASLTVLEKRLIENALNITHTKEFEKREMSTLSGGERQRVLIAGAIVQDTPLILLDEPLNYLDPVQRDKVSQLIKKIADTGKTVITVTHEINEAFSFSSRIIAMSKGDIAADGSSENIINSGVLEKVFSTSFHKLTHPETNRPLMFPKGGGNE